MQVISNRQNMTVAVTEESVGTYYCHAEVAGYKTITSRPGADVLMTGNVKIPFARNKLLIMNLQKHNPCISSLCLYFRPTKVHISYHSVRHCGRKCSYQLRSNIGTPTAKG